MPGVSTLQQEVPDGLYCIPPLPRQFGGVYGLCWLYGKSN